MSLTRNHEYIDKDGDAIEVSEPDARAGGTLVALLTVTDDDEGESVAAYVNAIDSVPLALNILGHDAPTDDREGGLTHLSKVERDRALENVVANLQSIIRFDLRTKRLATAEKRREAAAQSLTDAVTRLRNDGVGPLTGDEIGKLREALGRYDASLAN